MHEPFQGKSPQIDPEAYVHHSAVIIGDVEVGAESSVWPNATLRGDDGPIRVGSQTSIQDNAVVHMTEGRSHTTIGSRVTIGHGAIIHGCTIEDGCLIGMGSIVLDNAVVERGAIVGAGSLIPPGKRVPAGTLVMGSPFAVVRECTDADRQFIEFSWTTYVKRLRQFRGAG